MAYSGRYTVKNPSKYWGDPTKVFFRSLWERQVFRWLDDNPQVDKWQSEETTIPYICKTDGKRHMYYMDVKVKWGNGETFLIEIKPKNQTLAPKVQKRKTKKYIREVMTYLKNQSKWEAANSHAMRNGWKFQVWTEDTLKQLGIKLLTK